MDNDMVRADLKIQQDLDQATMNYGAQGSFGRVSGITHIFYETLPAPIVSLLRIFADHTFNTNQQRDWVLPANLTPVVADHCQAPTRNLLGYAPAVGLTSEQIGVLLGADFAFGANQDAGVENIGGLPINVSLLKSISNYLSSSKSPSTSTITENVMGSIAQIAYCIRDEADHVENGKLITDKSMAVATQTILTSSISMAVALFRYRVDRRYSDTYCYSLAPNLQRPQGWIDTKNNVFIYGYAPEWNRRRFSSPFTAGFSNLATYCFAIRPPKAKT